MKKQDKKKYEEIPEEAKPVSKKKVAKPWDLEYMIIDEKVANELSFFKSTAKVGEWIKDTWLKGYLTVDHSLQQLNKMGRSYSFTRDVTPINTHWRFAGKKFRLVNRDTGEIVPLSHNDREYYAERTEGEDPGGSNKGVTET